MKLTHTFRRLVEVLKASTLAHPETWFRESYTGPGEAWSGMEVTAATAMQVSAVAACVRLLSESIASLPLHVLRRTERSKRRAADHPLYELLHDAPNVHQTSYTWRQQAMQSVLLHGNAFALIERGPGGSPVALWPLPVEAVAPEAIDGELVYSYRRGGDRAVYPAADVIHFRGPTSNGISGQSVISMGRQVIGAALAMEAHAASLWKNRAAVGLVVEVPGRLKDKKEFEEKFTSAFAGSSKAGRPLIIDDGTKVHSVALKNEEAQFSELRKFAVQEIARLFRVPPHLIGDDSRLAYASSEQEMIAFQSHTLRPWLVNFEAELNAKLFSGERDTFAEHDMSALARGDLKTRYEAYRIGLGDKPFLEVNDVRAWENLPELSANGGNGGDA